MKLWQIHFLGTPRFVCEEQEQRLHAKETWALLACLLLPEPVGEQPFPITPQLRDRHVLAERFWGDKPDSRTNLRQALRFLRVRFAKDCFLADRDTVQAVAGRFVTDIEEMLIAYRKAQASETLDDRLHWLSHATGFIQGEFLEGCFQAAESGGMWALHRRGEIRSVLINILMAHADALTEAGRFSAALETTCRILKWQPDHTEAMVRARELADKIGQPGMALALGAEKDFQALIRRIRTHPEKDLTLTEERLFSTLFATELAALSPRYRKQFLRLAFFPAPFSSALAKTVCRVSEGVLRLLVKRSLIERHKDEFSLLHAVRAAAWRQVPTTIQRQIQKRLAEVCCEWVLSSFSHPPQFQPPFTTVAATPFLRVTLEWILQQPHTYRHIQFIYEANLLSSQALPYLEQAREQDTLPILIRCYAGHCAGNIRLAQSDYPEAIRLYARALVVMASELDPVATVPLHSQLCPGRSEGCSEARPCRRCSMIATAGLHFHLGLSYHHGNDSQQALDHLQRASDYYAGASNSVGVGHCRRVLCEILNHYGDYERALIACEEALTIRREIQPRWDSVADALYWKGMTLWRLKQPKEAADCFEEALSIWQETNDTTGIAFCLRMMGRLRCSEGRFAEARAHIEHAISLHERKEDRGSRTAAVEALADLFLQQRQFPQARRAYEECLAHSEARQAQARSEYFRAKIIACTP
jgi:tetratricopeptide (TPR) repeat protein